MDKRTRNIGIAALAAGALAYPAWLLYKYIANRNKGEEYAHKFFVPSYFKKNKRTKNRHIAADGELSSGLA